MLRGLNATDSVSWIGRARRSAVVEYDYAGSYGEYDGLYGTLPDAVAKHNLFIVRLSIPTGM